jgi:hypothetical protein
MDYKHVGRLISNKRKVVVAYRVVPGEPENCIVVTTENLMAEEHDALMKLVESDAGQNAYELAEGMARSMLPDGRNMLAGFHTTGKMIKIESKLVEMTPNRHTVVRLDQLNQIIAEQRGVSIEDLALKNPNSAPEPKSGKKQKITEAVVEPIPAQDPMSQEDLAAKMRSQADAMFKEAKKLREMAEELSPTKKKKVEQSA